jgi:L-ribulose-5-phosphate 3-epimerase
MRALLGGAAAILAGGCVAGRRDGAGAAAANEVSLAQWSLHRTIRRGELDPMDFPSFARERFGIRTVEYVNTFYTGRNDDAQWVAELARRSSGIGVANRLIMCDGLGMVGDPDASARAATVRAHERWMDIAVALGCMAIRVNARSAGDADEQVRLCADGLHALCDAARPRRLKVLVENHGGLSCDGAWVARLMRTVNLPECGTLPDFGNFTCADGTVADRYEGVEAMMPWAGAVSAKSGSFDVSGNETAIDYPRMMRIVRAAGYAGPIGIEYEGRSLGEVEGIEATKSLLLRLGCTLGPGERMG